VCSGAIRDAPCAGSTHGVPLTEVLGGGELASVDGLHFVVPVRTINAGPNPRYFGRGRGITCLNYTSDKSTGFHGMVVPGTLRDSLFGLDGLLENRTSLEPVEVTSDSAAYSDAPCRGLRDRRRGWGWVRR
jgi:TnpA family transposase